MITHCLRCGCLWAQIPARTILSRARSASQLQLSKNFLKEQRSLPTLLFESDWSRVLSRKNPCSYGGELHSTADPLLGHLDNWCTHVVSISVRLSLILACTNTRRLCQQVSKLKKLNAGVIISVTMIIGHNVSEEYEYKTRINKCRNFPLKMVHWLIYIFIWLDRNFY